MHRSRSSKRIAEEAKTALAGRLRLVAPAMLFLQGPALPEAPPSTWSGWWGWWWWAVVGALVLGALLYFMATAGRRRPPLGERKRGLTK